MNVNWGSGFNRFEVVLHRFLRFLSLFSTDALMSTMCFFIAIHIKVPLEAIRLHSTVFQDENHNRNHDERFLQFHLKFVHCFEIRL